MWMQGHLEKWYPFVWYSIYFCDNNFINIILVFVFVYYKCFCAICYEISMFKGSFVQYCVGCHRKCSVLNCDYLCSDSSIWIAMSVVVGWYLFYNVSTFFFYTRMDVFWGFMWHRIRPSFVVTYLTILGVLWRGCARQAPASRRRRLEAAVRFSHAQYWGFEANFAP